MTPPELVTMVELKRRVVPAPGNVNVTVAVGPPVTRPEESTPVRVGGDSAVSSSAPVKGTTKGLPFTMLTRPIWRYQLETPAKTWSVMAVGSPATMLRPVVPGSLNGPLLSETRTEGDGVDIGLPLGQLHFFRRAASMLPQVVTWLTHLGLIQTPFFCCRVQKSVQDSFGAPAPASLGGRVLS
jgi:hypothetical protein